MQTRFAQEDPSRKHQNSARLNKVGLCSPSSWSRQFYMSLHGRRKVHIKEDPDHYTPVTSRWRNCRQGRKFIEGIPRAIRRNPESPFLLPLTGNYFRFSFLAQCQNSPSYLRPWNTTTLSMIKKFYRIYVFHRWRTVSAAFRGLECSRLKSLFTHLKLITNNLLRLRQRTSHDWNLSRSTKSK